jgi:hypothetical protein
MLAYSLSQIRNSLEAIVKNFRLLALMLALGVFPAFSTLAHAQAEVDPDHYDQAPPKAQVSQSNHKVASATHKAHSNVRVASKHTNRVHHHQSRVSA